jgi:triosephosphate isomerase
MHGSLEDNQQWLDLFSEKLNKISQTPDLDIVIAPSYVYLSQIAQHSLNINLGVQDISEYSNGAYTGQVSASMVKDFGVNYVILGHSERRELCNEDDLSVAKKVKQALLYGLCPVVCVGESLADRQNNNTKAVVVKQLGAVLDYLKQEDNDLSNYFNKLVIAYEPVWAIGTGEVASPEQAQEVHGILRALLSESLGADLASEIRIIYGGSVKPSNVKELFDQPDIDGGLVGGASLDAQMFIKICSAVKNKS